MVFLSADAKPRDPEEKMTWEMKYPTSAYERYMNLMVLLDICR
jgi:hypothetical protein